MKKMTWINCKYCLAIIKLLPLVYATESANQFTLFDNNVTLGYNYAIVQNTSEMSGVGISANALLDSNIWLLANASVLLTYDLSNNQQGISNLYQNKSGNSFTLKGGYAFIFDKLNVVPYLGFGYSNMLLAYNYDSTQEFIFEDPTYSIIGGTNIEYVIIDRKLKLGLDTGISYAMHKSVVPNTNTTLGHLDYSQYMFNVSPSIQYNVTPLLTIMAYYGFASRFAGTAAPPNVYYPSTGTNSANIIDNDNIINSFGLKFGILF